ncbi:ABC-F family ATP-binding cassette domain-containing protein [Halobacillus sp. ACCC02827]|uniref:ribosomal protection-like ABC-F family protein n=1 Tax=Halobacillus sp. ACCC02827 TaxID=3052090 RepID=UPI002570E757|nr:ABC-F family ATP-binding cassette domain-containing protein [Halobacillus sp. ACCC02827]WJE16160.1 ABC-F family ATP-binding cassette domain-containing protein [Halobacillus sp. ACCC02827]
MMIITLKDINKIVGGEVLFEGLNMEWKAQQRIGLVGRNGSGKSTLFRIVLKQEDIDGGDIFIQKGLKIGYLEQIPSAWEDTAESYLRQAFQSLIRMEEKMKLLEKEMTDPMKLERAIEEYGDLQEEYTRLGGYGIDSSIRQVAGGLGITVLLNRSVNDLSGGEKTKLGLAKLLLEEPDVLLLDEPTNHLDLPAIEWLESYLLQYSGTVCAISHDRSFLDRVATDIMDLEAGAVDVYKGNYSAFEKQKEEKLLAEFHQYEEQQKKIKKMKEAIRRLRQWANEANPPNEKLFKKAKSMEKALERMEKLDKPILDPKKMKLRLDAGDRSGKDLFVVRSLYKAYQNDTILEDLHLHVRYQDRLAIVGANGSGKSTLLRMLLGEEKPDHGEIKRAPDLRIGYLPQQPLKGVDGDRRLIDFYREQIRVTEGEARHHLAGFLFYGYDVFRKLRHLSGGEQMRLKLAVFMHLDIQLLILDEPTNHLDVESQEVLEEALNQFDGTVIGVSHDRWFLNRCFTETAYMMNGQLKRRIGTYEETRKEWLESLDEKQKKDPTQPSQPEKVELPLEEQIQQLEQQLEERKRKGGEDTGTAKLQTEIDYLYERWLG